LLYERIVLRSYFISERQFAYNRGIYHWRLHPYRGYPPEIMELFYHK
jgi:hypothetical protein